MRRLSGLRSKRGYNLWHLGDLKTTMGVLETWLGTHTASGTQARGATTQLVMGPAMLLAG